MSSTFGPGRVALLTGPPGAGKTTVAARVAELVEPSVLVEGDVFFRALRTGRIPPWAPASHRQNLTVVRAIGAAVDQYARGGLAVVLEGLVAPAMLEVLREVCTAPILPVVIRPSPEVTMARATARGGVELVDPEPVAAMYRPFADLGAPDHEVVDSTHLSVEATVVAVATRLGLRPRR